MAMSAARSISTRLQKVARRVDASQERRPWMAFPIAVVRKFGDDRGSSLAALISYYTFFSLFPLLVVLATVTGSSSGIIPIAR
jgi:membrane protein